MSNTLQYVYGDGDKEYVFCCKNRPFAVPVNAVKTPPSRARRLVMDEGLSPLMANLATIDEMFGGADIMLDVEEEDDVLDKHGPDDNIVYKSGHGRYKCNLVQCDVTEDPWGHVPHNCGFHPDYRYTIKLQSNFYCFVGHNNQDDSIW